MYTIFDSHAHYDDDAFDTDRESLLPRLHENGICHIVNVGASLQGCRDSVALARQYPFLSAAVGVHPLHAHEIPADYLAELEGMLGDPEVVAVGEIGLDYHYKDSAPRDVQKEVFEAQLELAARHNLPVIIHDREAHGDTMEILRKYRPQGVVHCFSGSAEMAREVVSLGMYIGLGGVVTFKNARAAVEVAASIPLSSLLLETDAPYLAPEPHRGKRCDSSMIAYVADRIAQIRTDAAGVRITPEDICQTARQNAERLFGLTGRKKD